MNREEAKDGIIKSEYIVPDAFNLIDAIYNDFESRTCENCEHYNVSFKVYGDCAISVREVTLNDFRLVHKDFGCNKWQPN